jgi:hypothetical protein
MQQTITMDADSTAHRTDRASASEAAIFSSHSGPPADTLLHLPDDLKYEVTLRQNTTGQYNAARLLFDTHMLPTHRTRAVLTGDDLYLADSTATSPAPQRDSLPSQARHALEHRLLATAGIVLTRFGNQNVVSHFILFPMPLQDGSSAAHDA